MTAVEIRRGAYYDSVVLMQLQRSLTGLPGVLDAGVMMGTAANKDVLAQSDLLPAEADTAAADDLVIVIRAQDDGAAQSALSQVDDLLARRRSGALDQEYLPKSLESAVDLKPNAQWVLVSVAGRYAADLSRAALRLNRNVFLYSDNVSLDDEIALKHLAAERGLLVMGPDCGTAIVNGVGLGFANRVRRGPIGLVAASGTGLQQVCARIHQLGSGITHALGTGGRDLSARVNAVTTRQCLDLLARDPETELIILISKPPSPEVAEALLSIAQSTGKPVVIDFIGYDSRSPAHSNLIFCSTLDETAETAVELITSGSQDLSLEHFATGQRYLRGLFSGGTLAYEALFILRDYLPEVYSNAPLDKSYRLPNSMVSQGHAIVDLGEDEFTVGRLHPMMDNDLRIRRLRQEADDPETAVLLLDVVLGDGAHPDPAHELGPVLTEVKSKASQAGRNLEVFVIVVGTDQDPQNMEIQIHQLEAAGATVGTNNEEIVRHVGELLRKLKPPAITADDESIVPVDLAILKHPLSAINVGLESFTDSLTAQEAEVIQVDWRPPAGGNERLMAILERMKEKRSAMKRIRRRLCADRGHTQRCAGEHRQGNRLAGKGCQRVPSRAGGFSRDRDNHLCNRLWR